MFKSVLETLGRRRSLIIDNQMSTEDSSKAMHDWWIHVFNNFEKLSDFRALGLTNKSMLKKLMTFSDQLKQLSLIRTRFLSFRRTEYAKDVFKTNDCARLSQKIQAVGDKIGTVSGALLYFDKDLGPPDSRGASPILKMYDGVSVPVRANESELTFGQVYAAFGDLYSKLIGDFFVGYIEFSKVGDQYVHEVSLCYDDASKAVVQKRYKGSRDKLVVPAYNERQAYESVVPVCSREGKWYRVKKPEFERLSTVAYMWHTEICIDENLIDLESMKEIVLPTFHTFGYFFKPDLKEVLDQVHGYVDIFRTFYVTTEWVTNRTLASDFHLGRTRVFQ